MMKNYAIGIDMGGTGTKFGLGMEKDRFFAAAPFPHSSIPRYRISAIHYAIN